MTMGTASTMTAIAESIGMTLPGASSIPAADANHIRMASECGRRIVEMVWEDLTPRKIQTRKAFENAITVAMAMGCSTNAIIHLIAQASRAGAGVRRLSLDEEGDRRSQSRRHRRPRADPAQRRAAGRAWHAGMGHAADPDKTGETGRARHGAAVGCAHERHQLWRLHPACG